MGVTAYFDQQRLLSRSLAITLSMSMAWTPFGVSWADAMQNSGVQGQQTGQQILNGFQFPLDAGHGVMTLNPGTRQQTAINLNTLFPDSSNSQNGLTDMVSLYGNDAGTVTAGINSQTALATENSLTGDAFRTLINNAHQSHPDLQNDPLWKSTDQVLTNFTPWAQSFSDCTTITTQTATTQTVTVPNYQLCVRQPIVPQRCTATHQIRVEPLLSYVAGNGGISNCGPGCMDLYVGVVGDNYWSAGCGVFTWQVTYNIKHPEAITSATLAMVEFDDHAQVFYGGNLIYTGSSGWGGACELGRSWNDYPNLDVTWAFNSPGNKVFKQNTLVGGKGEGYARIRIKFDTSKLITQDVWSWDSGDCQNLANAITDGICHTDSQLMCNSEAANPSTGCYVDPTSQVTVCANNLMAAPVARSAGIASTCTSLSASGRCDLSNVGQCWSDSAGTHCLSNTKPSNPTTSCATLETQGCAFIKSQCMDVLASGTCWDSIDTYDCGSKLGIPGIQSQTTQQCSGPIRCMGEDCVTLNRTQSTDFTQAVALLNSAQQMAMDMSCDFANANLQQKDPTTCQVFKGSSATCKMVGGALSLVDCCTAPTGGMGLGQYIELLMATSQLDNAIMDMQATSPVRGAWEVLRTPLASVGDAWEAVQADFASGVNNLVGTDVLSVSDIAEQGLLDSLQGELTTSVAEWIGSTFGETAGNALFSAGGQAAFDSAGNLTPAAQSGGVELGGGRPLQEKC